MRAMAAAGDAGTGGGATSGWFAFVAMVGGLVVVAVAAALYLARRRELADPTELTPLPSDTEPPPPDRPLPRPLPPPEPPLPPPT